MSDRSCSKLGEKLSNDECMNKKKKHPKNERKTFLFIKHIYVNNFLDALLQHSTTYQQRQKSIISNRLSHEEISTKVNKSSVDNINIYVSDRD